jgi:ArsR family transcriptional regulator, arsenate/arsenite/antimonite-responsive transcriptional repressor
MKLEKNMPVSCEAMPEDRNSPLDTETFALVCKALGHPARLHIIEHLKRIDRCICGDIVDMLPLAQSTVSQHLKCLKEAGLVIGAVEGPRTCYCVNRNLLQRFKKTAGGL